MVPIGSRVTVDDISSAFVEKDDVEKRKRRRKSGVVYNSFMIIGKCFQYKNIFYTLVKSTILKSMLLGETNKILKFYDLFFLEHVVLGIHLESMVSFRILSVYTLIIHNVSDCALYFLTFRHGGDVS